MGIRRGADSGETLVELLVSITILGIAGVAILAGLMLAIRASDMQQKETTGGSYVRSYAEALEKYIGTSSLNYVPCAATSSYAPGVVGFVAPSGFTAKVISVQSVSQTGSVSGFGSPCVDSGVQSVRLSVASSDSRANEQLTVLIRLACVGSGANPCAS